MTSRIARVTATAAVALLIAVGVVVVYDKSSSTDSEKPSPRTAESSENLVPVTRPTILFVDKGIQIRVADESKTTVRRWDHEKRGFGRSQRMSDVIKSSTIPQVDKRPDSQTSLVVHEEVGVRLESSLLSTLRKPNGDLMPSAARIWSDRVEIAWRFDEADSWTVRRGNDRAIPVVRGAFVDRSAAVKEGGRYQIEGQLKQENVGKNGVNTVSYVVVVPPAPKGTPPGAAEDEAWAPYFNLVTSAKQ